jgi:3-oxoacyl-[acyl-carrier-protein] synthase II
VRRVLVTGIGVVGPTGIGKEPFWKGLLSGKSFIGPVTRFAATGYPSRIAGEVPDNGLHHLVDPKRLRRMPTVSRYAVAATRLALEDLGLAIGWRNPERVGVILGTSLGGYKEGSEQSVILHERGASRLNPFLTLSSYYHSTAGEVAIEARARGISLTQSVGCPSSLCAIGTATDYISQGRLDLCITGGAEAPLFPIVFGAMCQIHELSTMNERPAQASRPFDRHHNGIVLSEGSCILVLESEDHARRRDAHVYAEVAGYAIGCEAYEMYGIEPTGDFAAATVREALVHASCCPTEIGYISAHGNSCPRWDVKETMIIHKAFEKRARMIPVSSIKGAIGHNFGAAGAFQVASVALALQEGLLPATANLEEPDPECDLDYVMTEARRASPAACLVSNFGYGGVNAFLVLRPYRI